MKPVMSFVLALTFSLTSLATEGAPKKSWLRRKCATPLKTAKQTAKDIKNFVKFGISNSIHKALNNQKPWADFTDAQIKEYENFKEIYKKLISDNQKFTDENTPDIDDADLSFARKLAFWEVMADSSNKVDLPVQEIFTPGANPRLMQFIQGVDVTALSKQNLKDFERLVYGSAFHTLYNNSPSFKRYLQTFAYAKNMTRPLGDAAIKEQVNMHLMATSLENVLGPQGLNVLKGESLGIKRRLKNLSTKAARSFTSVLGLLSSASGAKKLTKAQWKEIEVLLQNKPWKEALPQIAQTFFPTANRDAKMRLSSQLLVNVGLTLGAVWMGVSTYRYIWGEHSSDDYDILAIADKVAVQFALEQTEIYLKKQGLSFDKNKELESLKRKTQEEIDSLIQFYDTEITRIEEEQEMSGNAIVTKREQFVNLYISLAEKEGTDANRKSLEAMADSTVLSIPVDQLDASINDLILRSERINQERKEQADSVTMDSILKDFKEIQDLLLDTTITDQQRREIELIKKEMIKEMDIRRGVESPKDSLNFE
ncbi:MAG: hypothetical protein H6621_07520 [Halobacteriovoraceae bacterium]|nr:hypothetical protein [Halobacteriovoraceae bacterium]